MKKVLFVCHGNICRSPMAEFVFRDITEKEGMDVFVASAATSTEELGNPPHTGTQKKLAELGIYTRGKVAVQMTRSDYGKYDYIIGMDDMNIRNILRITGGDPDGKVSKLLSFCGECGNIADPWYTGDFDATYKDILRGCKGLVNYI